MALFKETDLQENTGELKIPNKRGRPKGVRSRPKGETGMLLDHVEKVYKIIEHMLTDEQKLYYRRAFSGKEKFDASKIAEFFAILYGIYANNVLVQAIESNIVSQDIAQTLREYRMALKELDDMKRAREKELENNNDRLIDPTSKPKKSRIDEIIERAEREGQGGDSGEASS